MKAKDFGPETTGAQKKQSVSKKEEVISFHREGREMSN